MKVKRRFLFGQFLIRTLLERFFLLLLLCPISPTYLSQSSLSADTNRQTEKRTNIELITTVHNAFVYLIRKRKLYPSEVGGRYFYDPTNLMHYVLVQWSIGLHSKISWTTIVIPNI